MPQARLIGHACHQLPTQQRRRVRQQALHRATGNHGDADVSFAGRRVSLCLTTTPTTLEGQCNLLLDEMEDVTLVVKTQDRAGIANHMSVCGVVDRCVVEALSTQKTGVVVLPWTFVLRGDDRSSRLRQSSRQEGV